jgi:hypothetical protein
MSRGLSIDWRSYDGNSLEKARLNASLWNGHPPFPGIIHFQEPTKLGEMEFVFDIRQDEQYCWKTVDKNPRTFVTKDLADFLVKYLMDNMVTRTSEP